MLNNEQMRKLKEELHQEIYCYWCGGTRRLVQLSELVLKIAGIDVAPICCQIHAQLRDVSQKGLAMMAQLEQQPDNPFISKKVH